MRIKSNFFSAISMLVGTVVGAGMFGIPYVVSKVGFLIGMLYLIVLGVLVTVITLAYGEVIVRTKERFQMSGYAKKYLGIWGERVVAFSLIFGIYGALLAYTIGIGNFLHILLGRYFGGTPFIYSLVFYIISCVFLFLGLGLIERAENLLVFLLCAIVGLIFLMGVKEINFSNFTGFNLAYLFLPYGVILFAYEGSSIVPGMVDVLVKNKKKLKWAIIWGMLISFLVYALFVFIIVGITGNETSEEAIVGVGKILGHKIIIVGAILGILTISTSFFSLGLTLRDVYEEDLGMKKILAWFLVCLVPLVIFVLGARSFISVLEIVGTVTGGLQGIAILMMLKRAKEKCSCKPVYSLRIPRFLTYILYLIFGGGIIYQIIYNLVLK